MPLPRPDESLTPASRNATIHPIMRIEETMRAATLLATLCLACCGGAQTTTSSGRGTTGVSKDCVEFDIQKLDVSLDEPKGHKQVVHVDPQGDFPGGTDLEWTVESEGVEVVSHSVKGGKLQTKLDIGELETGDRAVLTVSVSGRCDKALVVFREHLDLCMHNGGLELLPYEDADCGS